MRQVDLTPARAAALAATAWAATVGALLLPAAVAVLCGWLAAGLVLFTAMALSTTPSDVLARSTQVGALIVVFSSPVQAWLVRGSELGTADWAAWVLTLAGLILAVVMLFKLARRRA